MMVIVWFNVVGGELDRRYAQDEKDATEVLREMVAWGELHPGDCIRIEKTEDV